jgi:hypothetical protein
MSDRAAITTDLPITAEIVPPPSPFRFGLRALMGLMVVCSLQFALMSYLTVLPGLIVGTLLCMTAFAVVLLTGLIAGRRNDRLLERLDAISIRLVLATFVLCIGTMFAGGGVMAYQYFVETRTALGMDRELGLLVRRIKIVRNSREAHGLQVLTVFPGGIGDQAGLKTGDVILPSGTVVEHYQTLENNRGRQVDLHVAFGADLAPVEDCPQRAVPVVVPR